MKYELFLNANNGAYSDRIGTFDTLEELREKAKNIVEKQLYNYDADKENLSAIGTDENDEEMDIEIF